MANFERSAQSTLGISLTAAMLMAACGGSDPAAPSADAPPAADAPPIVQPVWGSPGVLVAPGQASKTFTWPTGCFELALIEGEQNVDLFNAELKINPNGDLSFKAANTSAANAPIYTQTAISIEEAGKREVSLSAHEGSLHSASYTMALGEGKYINISSSAVYVRTEQGRDIRCSAPAIAEFMPATAFFPSEQRATSQFLAGADSVYESSALTYDAIISNSAFVWTYDSETDPIIGYSVNLSTGQLSTGTRADPEAGLTQPTTVNFSQALQGNGSYSEVFDRTLSVGQVRVAKISTDDHNIRVSRINNELYVGDWID